MTARGWSKIVRDLTGRPARTLLAVLAMAVGVFQITAMLYKYAVLEPELTTMYDRTNPSSATITTDASHDALVDSVRGVPGVGAAEARPMVFARAEITDGEWIPAVLYVVRDFDRQAMDTFTREDGAWPPAADEIAIERSALEVVGRGVDDSLTLKLPGGAERRVRIAGTVHAKGLAPAWMEHMVPAFVPWSSTLRGEESAQIRIAVAEHRMNEGHVREVADSVRAMLERGGHAVPRITVPVPGRHPHADQMESFLFLLLAFGVLSFLLSAIIVAGMIHALMAEQVRQIGIMKAIGASSGQVATIYLGHTAALALAALALGIPPGVWAGHAYAEFAAGILNADISRAAFPWWLIAAELVLGLIVPLLVAMTPVRRAAGRTVREALADDPAPAPAVSARIDCWSPWVSRPLALSVRGVLMRRGRLALTVGGLAVGGAAFMAALNVAEAWQHGVDADFARRRYDITVRLADPHPIAAIDAVLAGVPSVVHAEYVSGASPYLIDANGAAANPVNLLGIAPGSELLDLPLVAGRWLAPQDGAVAVINTAVARENPSLRVGGEVAVRLEGRTLEFPIVGIVRELMPMATIYTPRQVVLAATGDPGLEARSVRLVTREHDDAGPRAAAREIEAAFEAAGLEIAMLQRMQDLRASVLDHLVIILSILTVASVIVVAVGGLGLASTLALSVVQRTREIGVLGAIGATPGTIARHIWIEALLFGALGWVLSLILTLPMSDALGHVAGNIFLKNPLPLHLSPLAAGLWLAVVFVIATVCSIHPAWRAARMPVYAALSHT